MRSFGLYDKAMKKQLLGDSLTRKIPLEHPEELLT
jgi:hypothetical protein